MTGARVIWYAQRADTGAVLSAPYFTGAAARTVAQRHARRGARMIVTRDGRAWTAYAPDGAETELTREECRTDWSALARAPRDAETGARPANAELTLSGAELRALALDPTLSADAARELRYAEARPDGAGRFFVSCAPAVAAELRAALAEVGA